MHNEYLEHLRTAGLRPKTVKVAESALKKWAGWEALANGVSFRDWLGAQKQYSPGYKNAVIQRVNAMLSWGRDNARTDMQSVRPFPKNTEPPKVLTSAEVHRFTAACLTAQNATATTALCCLLTGARHREILTLTRKDITEQGVHITASQSKNRTGRIIPRSILSPGTQALLRSLPHKHKRADWDRLRTAAGLPGLLTKTLRSTAGTYFVNRGLLTPYQVAAVMGHSTQVAEKHYWNGCILGLTGDWTSEWLGVHSLLKGEE